MILQKRRVELPSSCVNVALMVLSLMEMRSTDAHEELHHLDTIGVWSRLSIPTRIRTSYLLAWMWTEKWSDHWDWARVGGDGVQWHGWKFGHDQKWKFTSILLLDVMPTCKWIFWREIQKCPPEGLSLHMIGCQQTCSKNWASTQSCTQLTRPVLALSSTNKVKFSVCSVRLCCKEKKN